MDAPLPYDVQVLEDPLLFFVLVHHLDPANVVCLDKFKQFGACGASMRYRDVVEYFDVMAKELAHGTTYLIFKTVDDYTNACKPGIGPNVPCPCMGCAIIATNRKADFNHDLRKERGEPPCLSSIATMPTSNSAALRSRRQPNIL